MSDVPEPIEIDESILNQEENQANSNIDLNDDQIAVLLGDSRVPETASNETAQQGNGEEATDILLVEEDASEVVEPNPDTSEAIDLVENDVIREENDEVILEDDDAILESGHLLDKEVITDAVINDEKDVILEEDNGETSGEKENLDNNVPLEDLENNTVMDHGDSPTVLIIEENESCENVDSKNSDEIEGEDVTEAVNSSRKRTGSNHSPRSPVHKRKRRVHTYFATRQAAINLVTQLMGSYDGMLYRKDLQFFVDCRQIRKEQMFNANAEHLQRLRTENKKLRDQLNDEKRAHTVTLRKLLSLDKEMQEMREKLKELYPLLTQPSTPEVEQRLFPKHINMPPPHPHHRMNVPPERIIVPVHQRPMPPRRAPAPSTSTGNFYVAPPQPTTTAPVRIAHQPPPPYQPQSHRSHPAPLQMAPTRRVTQRGVPPAWQSIPTPATNLGHTHEVSAQAVPQNLKDDTDASSANTIMLCVPLIPAARIYPFLDMHRPPNIPHRFKSLTPSAHLTVTINSTAADFRDNWQIGGKVGYEKLKNLHKKKIQVFVQVSSFKACGMGAHLPMSNDPIEWGISSAWPCKPKLHKFRIRFHQQQQVPENDKITVFAVAWSENGTLDISVPVSMAL